jgi:hypothetical protein
MQSSPNGHCSYVSRRDPRHHRLGTYAMTIHRFWLLVGGLSALLMAIFLCQGAYAIWYFVRVGIHLSVAAILKPFTSPLIPMSLALAWTLCTIWERTAQAAKSPKSMSNFHLSRPWQGLPTTFKNPVSGSEPRRFQECLAQRVQYPLQSLYHLSSTCTPPVEEQRQTTPCSKQRQTPSATSA